MAANTPELACPPSRENASERQRFLGDFVHDTLIGSAPQVAAGQEAPSPFFGPHAFFLNEAFGRGELDPMWLLASPASELETADEHLTPIVFLRPRDPQGFAVSAPPGMDRDEVFVRLTAAATSVQMTAAIEAESRREAERALVGLRWLRGDRTPVMIQFDLQQVRTLDGAPLGLVDPDSHLAPPDDQLPYLWGRCVLMPPAELDPDGDLHIPANEEIRSYIRHLHERFPAFPLILSWLPEFSAFFDWFGSLTRGDVSNSGSIAADESTILAVVTAAQAMLELGDRLEQNPRALIDLMVTQLPSHLRSLAAV